MRKNTKTYFVRQRVLSILYVFCGTLIVSALAFVSLPASIMGFGCFSLGLFLLLENQRRQKWETAHNFKIMTINENYDTLSKLETRNRHTIQTLQRNVSEIVTTIENDQSFESVAKTRESLNEKEDMYTTRRQRPFSSLIANDDPFSDHKSLSDMVVKELVQTAVNQKNINVFVQPIVTLPQRQTAGFEVFARIRAKAGLYVPAARYMQTARNANLLKDIDSLLLKECLSILKEYSGRMEKQFFFLNIETANLKNKAYMSGLLAFVAKNRELAEKLVFEIRYADYQSLPAPLMQIMTGLAKLGCRFSLDHVDDMEFHMQDLIKKNIRFLKISASWMMSQTKSDMDFTHVWRSKSKLEANGIKVIVDRIEHEHDLRALLDFDPHFGQGYLFGKPDIIGSYKPFAYTQSNLKRKGVEEKFG